MPTSVRLAVTTSRHVSDARRSYARCVAQNWSATYVERSDRPLSRLHVDFDAVVVFEQSRVRLADRHADIVFHPGMAYQRITRLCRGETDPLVQVAGIGPGQRVLDATLGFGQDALVTAAAVGESGHVTGLEASRTLAVFAAVGLPSCDLPNCVAGASAPIDVHHAEAEEWLRGHDARFDVVVLDPMFAAPKRAQPSFGVLRRYAWHAPLTDRLLAAAMDHAPTVAVKLGSVSALSDLRHVPQLVRRSGAVVWARFARSILG